ncbi:MULTISPECIES: transcription antitermination factor NusB [Dermacoccus]|jgi:N utilization substance protein B|uniref:Transcription antitermination protein NusB n=2 Tax=Dermacoccus TaxID=57495 RepID=A0ABX5Z9B6_9MICO|nr:MULTISPECIES: transcription antitermination factor NusB [Dermacoccus]KLO61844.1 antitermination protein NusB [Dermacoccus sp. PE3]MBE7372836.1 transcription antitermination factor NusB [Dermacoccus barathri]MBZ4498215.1 transcription antitermination factor NusB [Dermacoccus sp. Tok2021]MCT1987143.1 transcription antitermination factor NusB [Dermacoccus abyssi]QEH93394.1 transcription antitermination factor NusB [Dermacoccus abyssi]
MGARTKARKRALDLLFEAEQRGVNARDLLDERVLAPVTPAPLPEYTAVLVRGVVDNWRSINEALETYAKGWSLERMPAVDRALLRVSAYEVLYVEDVPDGVAVSEAKNLATELSTDNSPQFIGGLLTKLSEVKSSLVD